MTKSLTKPQQRELRYLARKPGGNINPTVRWALVDAGLITRGCELTEKGRNVLDELSAPVQP